MNGSILGSGRVDDRGGRYASPLGAVLYSASSVPGPAGGSP
jgi:hypothetical protein